MNCTMCWGEDWITINWFSYYCHGCIESLPKDLQHAFERLRQVSDEAMFNSELWLWVEKDWRTYKESSMMPNRHWWVSVRKGNWMRYHDNGKGYMIANITVSGKYKALSQHRVVYSTFNSLPYDWDYDVGHFDDEPGNNILDNLYWIFDTKKSQKNRDHKKNAYRLLEMCSRGELYTYNWEMIKL